MRKLFILGSTALLVMPMLVFSESGGGIVGIISIFNNILSMIIPVLVTLAVVYFIWGVIQYLLVGNEEKKKKAKEVIFSGLIGLFVIISFWGIIRVISNTINVGPERFNERAIPCIPNDEAGITCK